MFRILFFFYLLLSMSATAMNPSKVHTADEKAGFFLKHGWQSSQNLMYPGDYLGSLNLLGICHGAERAGAIPYATILLQDIASAFIIAAGEDQLLKNGTVMLDANYATVQELGIPSPGLREFYKRLIENANIEKIVITINNPNNIFNDAIYIAPSGDRGFGAYASRNIRPHEVLIEYVGEVWLYNFHLKSNQIATSVCRKKGADIADSLRKFKDTNDSVYSAALLPRDPQLILLDMPTSSAEPDSSLLIDAKKVRNETAFLNHSRSSNCTHEHVLKITLSSDLRIFSIEYSLYLYPTKFIAKDEELLWDYQLDVSIERLRSNGIVLTDIAPTIACYSCGASKPVAGMALSKCGRCQTARYCSRECQVKDWPKHKGYCVAPEKAISEKSPTNKMNSAKGAGA